MAEKNKKTEIKETNAGNEESLSEMTELLKRTQANFENYRKQSEKHNEEMRKMAAKDVIMQILPVIDNFELALKNVETGKNSPDFVQGIELIYSQLAGMLKDNDVEQIETLGQSFNPHLHEALMKVESELPENKIVEEFQKGFTLNGKVIRHAKVKVSAGPENKTNSQNKTNQENKKD